MKPLLLFVSILSISCADNSTRNPKAKLTTVDSIFLAEGFDTASVYADAVCLQYKGKPVLTIGQNTKQLDTTFSYRRDPNGKYEKHFQTVTDYLSLDDFYSAELSTGSIVGAFFFLVFKKGQNFLLQATGQKNAPILSKTARC
jgi:hypothetical protein